MLVTRTACLALSAASALTWTIGSLHAQEAKPHVPLAKTIGVVTATGPVPSLFVVNSAGARLDGDILTMTGVSANSIVFADRPVRAAGHVTTAQFINNGMREPTISSRIHPMPPCPSSAATGPRSVTPS